MATLLWRKHPLMMSCWAHPSGTDHNQPSRCIIESRRVARGIKTIGPAPMIPSSCHSCISIGTPRLDGATDGSNRLQSGTTSLETHSTRYSRWRRVDGPRKRHSLGSFPLSERLSVMTSLALTRRASNGTDGFGPRFATSSATLSQDPVLPSRTSNKS